MEIRRLLAELTVEEKAALVAGTDFMYTNGIARLKIPSLRMSDGPHGLRVQTEGGDNGVTGSLPATAFPTAATVASGWNPKNAYAIGQAIGREAHHYGIHVVLGPGVNIKRNPKAGRNFEYYSEDPYLAGKIAAAEVQGIQSEGVGACVKHFALNNAENYRFMGDSIADLRAIREIYLKVFEIVVKEAKPAAMMCAYNKVNGEFCSQNKWLLTDVLRGEWGFDGLVMTDWGAMHDRVASLKAGLDLEMPGDTAICRKWILDGIESGALAMDELDRAVENVLNLVERYAKKFADECDFEQNDRLACAVAEDCAILLKNEGVLPLEEGEKLFVCGDLFEKMRYQGAGSSMINPAKLTSPRKAFDEMGISYAFARGYAESNTRTKREWIDEALERSKGYETVLVFAGLTDYVESEGCDRETMRLPENQLALIEALCKTGKKVVVVLFGGAPFELPFAEDVRAILNMYLPGQSGGRACANLLFGRANPSGRLAESWPLRYADVPFGDAFGKSENEVYKESIFVGYRYYSTAKREVRYPFGYGLSYTTFAYSDLQVSAAENTVCVRCTVKNTGARAGGEVVQLYVCAPQTGVCKAEAALQAFEKVYLDAGQSKTVTFYLPEAEFAHYDARRACWAIEGGDYECRIASDCNTTVLAASVRIEGETESAPDPLTETQAYAGARLERVTDEVFEKMSGRKVPRGAAGRPITLESRFSALAEAGFFGRVLSKAVLGVADREMKRAKALPAGAERENRIKGAMFMRRVLESNSLLSMSMSAGKTFPYNFAEGFMHLANGKLFKGIRCFCTKIKASKRPKKSRRCGKKI